MHAPFQPKRWAQPSKKKPKSRILGTLFPSSRPLAPFFAGVSKGVAMKDFSLEKIKVASPCHASWAQMSGDERVRLCGLCSKYVYDLSAMSRAQAESLVQEKEGKLCVRFYRRKDGTVLTADCPVGLRAVRRKVAMLAGAALAILVGILFYRRTNTADEIVGFLQETPMVEPAQGSHQEADDTTAPTPK